MSEVIRETPEDGIALVRINRPESLNALNLAVRKGIGAAFEAINADPDIRAVILTGDEKSFAAGADIKEMADLTAVDQLRRAAHQYFEPLANCPKPVIAAINGYALGGGLELAMYADIIIVGETAQVGQPEVRVGIIPGSGGTQRLTRAVGKYKAMRLILTGKPISGREAFDMGLASEVVPDGDVMTRALETARTISRMAPLAVATAKEVILAGQDASLETGLMLERKANHILFSSNDQKEGMTAFAEKRRPTFKGN